MECIRAAISVWQGSSSDEFVCQQSDSNDSMDLIPMHSTLLSCLLLIPLRGQEPRQKQVGIPHRGRSALIKKAMFIVVAQCVCGLFAVMLLGCSSLPRCKTHQTTPADASIAPPLKPIPNHPGFYTSPTSSQIDLRGFAPGTEIREPHTGVIYAIPRDPSDKIYPKK